MARPKRLSTSDIKGLMQQTKTGSKFLLHLHESAEACETVRGLLHIREDARQWEGYSYVPPGSVAERIVQAFERHTDIPLELPFHALLFYLSGYLMNQGVRIRFGGRERTPEIWTIVLAPSGCGKSFSASMLAKAAPVAADFPECASGAKFLQAMAEHEQSRKPMLWLQDEFAQKLKQIEAIGSPMADAKEYLLRAYDGGRIERCTKTAGSIVVERPCLAILGLNTDEGFFKSISPESLVDGFAQRFGYVLASRDARRPMRDFPIYDEAAIGHAVEQSFAEVGALLLHPVYEFGKPAELAYCEAFRELSDTADIPESFYRRAMFRTVKYALIYHLLLGKHTDIIDAEDVGWAARLCRQQLIDARRMLAGSLSDLNRMIGAAERLRERLASEGKPCTPRDIARGVHGIKSAAEARGLLSLLETPELPLAT